MRALFSSLAVLAVLAVGSGSLWAGTDGLQAFTAEAAWRAEVAAHPQSLPSIWLQDQDGRRFRLTDYRGRHVLVEFFYTRCLTICSFLGTGFARLDRRLLQPGAPRDVALVSISLDPRDGVADLSAYAERERADGRTWRLARATSPDDLACLLRAFHVVRVPLPGGGFQHNAAIEVLDARGRLAAIADATALSLLLDRINGARK
ncbi:MAG TPA: SCO family protein [Oscillatoriaceae cyanobacterium]